MGAKLNAYETALLKHIFQNLALALIGDAAGVLPSAAAGSLYAGLHTAQPGEAADQDTNEVVYTGYARVAVARSAAGWAVAGSNVDNVAAVTFGECTVGSTNALWVIVGTDATGAGLAMYEGVLTTPLAITVGVIPTIPIGDLNIQEL